MKPTRLALILPFLALAACETSTSDPKPEAPPRTPGATVSTDPAAAAASEAATGTVPDTLPEASARQAAAGSRLGITVASLGDATQGGMWMKTPLIRTAGNGRVVNPANGKSVNVSLIPLDGPASGGSQVSLPALTALGVSPTDLPSLEVYSA